MDAAEAFNLLDRKRPERATEVISTGSFGLDLALGGGLRRGYITEYYGDYSTYKTTLAMYAAKSAQAFGPVLWVDVNGEFNLDHAMNIGLDVNHMAVLAPVDALQTLRIMRDVAPEFRLIVVDSAGQLDVPEDSELSWWYSALDWMVAELGEAGTAALFINTLKVAGDNHFTRALRDAAFARVVTYPGIGKGTIQAVVTKNSCARPFKHELMIHFDTDAVIDPNYEIARLAVATGVASRHGSFLHFKDQKFHGAPALRDALDKDPALAAEVMRAVTERGTKAIP